MSDITSNYHRGNPESIAAYESIKGSTEVLRDRVVAWVKAQGVTGATSEEVEVAFSLTHQSISARMTEAKVAALLVPSGEKRKTSSGRNAAVLVSPEYFRNDRE